MVGGDGQLELLLHGADDVEVVQGGLDHEEIGALQRIQLAFDEGLAAVGGVHLVGLLVLGDVFLAAAGGAVERVAEGPVESTGIFSGVGHDASTGKAVLVEHHAQGLYPTVHHIGRPQDVETRFSLGQAHLLEDVQGLVVNDLTLIDQAVMPVGAVGVHGYVADEAGFRETGLDGAGSGEIEIVVAVAMGRPLVFVLVGDFGEEDKTGQPQLQALLYFAQGLINRQAESAGQGGHFLPHLVPID